MTHVFVCLFYLVLKHSLQGLVKDLDGNKYKNISKNKNKNKNKQSDVVNNLNNRYLSIGWDLIPYPILH